MTKGDLNHLRAELFVLSEDPGLDCHQVMVLDAAIKALSGPIPPRVVEPGGWFLYFFVGYLGFAVGLMAGLLLWR